MSGGAGSAPPGRWFRGLIDGGRAARLGAAPAVLEGAGDSAKERHKALEADAIEDLLAALLRFERPGVSEGREVARDDGEIDGAAGVEFAHAAGPAAGGQAHEQGESVAVGQGSEEPGVEEIGQFRAAGLSGR